MKVNETIKKTIQSLRKQKGLIQKDVAKSLGITTLTYQRYEYGDRIPDAKTAIQIAEIFDTNVESIWGKP